MTIITLESIKAEHAKLAEMITAFEQQHEPSARFFPEVTTNLAPGEHYAGLRSDSGGSRMSAVGIPALQGGEDVKFTDGAWCKHRNGWYVTVRFWIFSKRIFVCSDCGHHHAA